MLRGVLRRRRSEGAAVIVREQHQRNFPQVGDIVVIEFQKMFKAMRITKDLGPEEGGTPESSEGLLEIAGMREEAVNLLSWLDEPAPNIIIADIIASAVGNEPLAPRPGKFLWLTQDEETGELDILDLRESEVTHPGSNCVYWKETRPETRDGLSYVYAVARISAVVLSSESPRR